ncbi:MAG: UvrD-helicase domain-containing protein [Alistipes sp.]
MRAKILNASAGSGKTYQLAYKYVHDVVEQPTLYRNILAVTFTNKATEEMKTRILKEIHTLASGGDSSYLEKLCKELKFDEVTVRKRAREVRSKILHDYSRFTVLTIDTFFQRIMRAFIKELGIDLNYNVEIETTSILAKSADTLIEQITTDHDLQQWLTAFVQERIDKSNEGDKRNKGVNWDIRNGILALGGELFKETNKESLTKAHSKEELKQIIESTIAAAESSKQQLREVGKQAVAIITGAGLEASDFSGKSNSFARYFFAIAAGEIKPYTNTVAQKSNATDGWCAKNSPAQPLVGALQPLLRTICNLYDGNIRAWNTCDLLRENYRSFALLSDLYTKVQELCNQQNTMLLSETKYILSEFIDHNDAPFIYEKVGNRFERFMIDEFQDTSVKEWENFLPLLQNAMSQSEAVSVLLVGDIKQSIYRWRGGDWKILHRQAQQVLGHESTEVINLKENFRSLPLVVDFNNKIIRCIVETDNHTLNTLIDEATARGAMAQATCDELHDTLANAYQEHEQTPHRHCEHDGYVSITTFEDRPPVIERICELLDKGFRPCDMLILVRRAIEGAEVAAELLEFKRNNEDPRYRFDVMTREALIVGNAPISSFVTATLRLALNPDDSLNRAIYNHYLNRNFDKTLPNNEREFLRAIRLQSPEEAFERLVMQYNLQNDKQQIAYLQAIHEQIIAFSANKVADISLFLRWWDEQGQTRSLSIEQSASTIEITTIHKAKGLEKRVVIIPYCSWKLDPKPDGYTSNIVWAETHDAQAKTLGHFPVKYKQLMAESGFSEAYYREFVYTHVDNINVLYVALTRAAESLHIFIPKTDKKSVGNLLLQSLKIDDPQVDLAGTTGRHTTIGTTERFEFGEYAGPVVGVKEDSGIRQVVLQDYPTAAADLRLRLPSQRYFDAGETELSPRNFGILMHKAFEEADNEEQIRGAICRMQSDGTLTAADAETLHLMITRALEHPAAREWFGGGWQRVRNENEIIIPGNATTRRPDRVMLRGTRAVVVDYKFGACEPEQYHDQIRKYLCLLREMGYTEVEGYLWYVKLGTIEQVEA